MIDEYFEKIVEFNNDELMDLIICVYLGVAYKDLEQVLKAKEFYEKAMEINLAIFGENNRFVSLIFQLLGDLHSDIGDYLGALGFLIRH